ncbi:MAG: ABC transporter ATP-binding protein [Propionibacteriaceae bacterium]
MSGPLLDADRLTKAYGRTIALRGVSLTVSPGEAVGLLGPNGAGKTTTVKILTGLVRPSSGTARLFGHPATDPAARTRLGYLPELFRFPDWMTGAQVVSFHAELAGVSRPDRAARVRAVLEEVGLGARGRDRVSAYSKGMSQRLGLAQAIVGRPELLLLDEPTSALDPVGRRDVRELVSSLKADGVAVVLNSHLLSEVERVCDRVVVIDKGHVKFSGTLDQLTGEGPSLHVTVGRTDEELVPALAEFGRATVSGNDVQVTLGPPWDDVPDEAAEQVAGVVTNGPWGLRGLAVSRASLEDAFVSMVSGGDT